MMRRSLEGHGEWKENTKLHFILVVEGTTHWNCILVLPSIANEQHRQKITTQQLLTTHISVYEVKRKTTRTSFQNNEMVPKLHHSFNRKDAPNETFRITIQFPLQIIHNLLNFYKVVIPWLCVQIEYGLQQCGFWKIIFASFRLRRYTVVYPTPYTEI